jgi:hypothetical protein
VAGCKKSGGGSGTNPFVGKWAVQPERSIAEGKKSPKYESEPQAKMLGFISAVMDSPSLEITPDEMVFVRGQERTAQAYTVKSRDDEDGTMTVTAKADGKSIEIVFTLLEDGYMNFKSSDTDDMNYYIWEPETGSE